MEFEPKLYNPAAQPEDFLIEHFVVRTKVFERLFDDIRTSDMKYPEQHYLIQGQRGMGKTTLLLRLKYEIERTPELNQWLIPVFFNEESYDLTSLSGLWEKLLKYFDLTFSDGGKYYHTTTTDEFVNSYDYEKKCFELVINILHQHKKKILILFDNFGELFLDNLNEKESHRFREILMNNVDIRLVAASAVVLESTNDYKAPFFDFFKIINLEGLNKNETLELIKKLQEKSTKKIDLAANKAKIETLAILTGGVIRTIMMLYEILLNDNDGSALKDLESILDKVTPLYKHRMEDLKPQQRRIMDVIAKNWDAISTKDISENVRENGKPVPSKIISAQLQELERNNLIEKIKTSTKNNLYIVKERFFNIWYLMRHGDKTSQCKVKWLTRFLEMWYGEEIGGMDGFIGEYIKKLKTGNFIQSSAINFTNALLASSMTSSVNQAKLLHATQDIVSESEIKYLTTVDNRIIEEANSKIQEKDYKFAITLLENTNPKNFLIIKLLGITSFLIGDYLKTIHYLLSLTDIIMNKDACFALGTSYYFLGEKDKALIYLKSSLPDNDRAAIMLYYIYESKNDRQEAEKYYHYIVDKSNLGTLISFGYQNMISNSNEIAIDILNRAENIDNNNILIKSYLCLLYYKENNFALCEKYADITLSNINEIRDIEYRTNVEFIIKLNLIYIYFVKAMKKEIAIKYLHEILSSKNESISIDHVGYIISSVLLWNNEFEHAINNMNEYLCNKKILINDIILGNINGFIVLLLSKKQYHSALKIFNENTIQLKDLLKPTYYTLRYLMKDEFPDEYLKMGRELEQPVKDILKKVEQYCIDYA